MLKVVSSYLKASLKAGPQEKDILLSCSSFSLSLCCQVFQVIIIYSNHKLHRNYICDCEICDVISDNMVVTGFMVHHSSKCVGVKEKKMSVDKQNNCFPSLFATTSSQNNDFIHLTI